MIYLDKKRLDEIMNSTGIIDVRYNNKPVWIEGMSTEDDGMVMISDMNTKQRFSVDISDLRE